MLRLITDQNFSGDILRGLYRRRPDLNVVRVQEAGLSAASDVELLASAAADDRILLTHDRSTVPDFAYDRVRAGQAMPGVFVVSDLMPIGQAIDEILLAAECLASNECINYVRFFPL